MSTIQTREEKIQEKRQHTDWRDFVKDIASWFPVVFHKNNGYMSRYPESGRVKNISSNKDFDAIRNNMDEYGVDYDPTIWFFEQFQHLMQSIPLGATIRQMAGENTDYADSIVASSNAYLSSVLVNDCSDVLYSFIIFDYCKTIVDSFWVWSHSEDIYHSTGITKSSNIFYSRYIANSSNIWFSSNLIGCHNCIQCSWLENMSYCIENVQYSKEEYKSKKEEILQDKSRFEWFAEQLPITSNNYGSTHITGNHITMSTDIENGYFINRVQNGRNIICVGWDNQEKNYRDVFDSWVTSSDVYAVEGAGYLSNNLYCCTQVEKSSHIFYSYYLANCSYCLGCIGLQNKQFCIFNKQYSKEDRHTKVDEIFAQMEKKWTLGEFFPGWMNPFYFNDTAASLIEDFDKEDIQQAGYMRCDEEIKVDIPDRMDVVAVDDLSDYEWFDDDGNREIDPSILKKVIRDEKGNIYRIIKMEYDFLMKYELPLPRKHWLERLRWHFRMK